jgi:hypothetical protein
VTASELSAGDGLTVNAAGATVVHRRVNYLSGRVDRAVPAGTQLWVVTNPDPGDYYVQSGGPVTPDADGRFRVRFNAGGNDQTVQKSPDPVQVVQVVASVGAYLASCHATPDVNPRLPTELPWHVAGTFVVLKVA